MLHAKVVTVDGEAAVIGKTPGKDAEAGKATFLDLLGPDEAEEQAQHLAAQAIAHLDQFDKRADLLREVAAFVVDRDR